MLMFSPSEDPTNTTVKEDKRFELTRANNKSGDINK